MKRELKSGSLISISAYDMDLKDAIAIIVGQHKTCSVLYRVFSNGKVFYVHDSEVEEIYNVI